MVRKILILLIIKLISCSILVDIYDNEIFTGIGKLYSQDKVGTKEQLKVMNSVANPSFIDTCNNQTGKSFKLLVIGNSLTRHGIAENIGWTRISGMAATSVRNDFVHLLFYKIENLLPSRKICLRMTNFADFERNYNTFDFKATDNLVNYQPDVIVFQLGENVSFNTTNTTSLFESKYIELINCFKKNENPIIICTTPFFPSAEKNQIIEQVVLKTKSYLADLSHLPLLDKENYAKDEKDYKGNRSEWKNEGIGIHPGDYGMKNIAQELFIIINATIVQNK